MHLHITGYSHAFAEDTRLATSIRDAFNYQHDATEATARTKLSEHLTPNHESTATVLILPEWIDASYKKAHLLNHPYMQKMCELPADLAKFPSQDKDTQTAPNKDPGTNWPVGVMYLVASASYLIAKVNAA
eukprot:jgi/Tetstr1/425924/TSEL_001598.t1